MKRKKNGKKTGKTKKVTLVQRFSAVFGKLKAALARSSHRIFGVFGHLKIGLRTIKTVLALLLCFSIDALRGGNFPFFSLTAAIFCMQKDIESSKKASGTMIIGTFIGGAYGLILLLIFQYALKIPSEFIEHLICAIAVIPLIQIVVALKRHAAVYMACVVYLSILVTHGGETDPFVYAFGRVSDTLIGILVSLFVNWIPFLNRKIIVKNDGNE